VKTTGKIRTLRGTMSSMDGASSYQKRQVILDDGLINQGYRILSFTIWPRDFEVFANGGVVYGILSTESLSNIQMEASDNRQIAWSQLQAGGLKDDIIDPNHIVNRDLYVRTYNNKSATTTMNYLIVMEEISLSDDEAIISIIKEQSQDV